MEEFHNWGGINLLALAVNYYLFRLFKNFRRGVHWNHLLFHSPALGKERSPNPWLCLVCGVIAVAGIGCVLFYSAGMIRTGVWENRNDHMGWLLAYATLNFSLLLLSAVVRDYQNYVHGAPVRILSAEQNELLRRAIFEGNLKVAAKLYRRAFPDVVEHEASDFVARLDTELKSRHPEKFAHAPKWWELNWWPIRICLIIQICALKVSWGFLMSLKDAPWQRTVWGLCSGYITGVVCVLVLPRKFPWLGLITIVLLGIAPALMAHNLAPDVFSNGVLFGGGEGFVFGASVILCGRIPRRRK